MPCFNKVCTNILTLSGGPGYLTHWGVGVDKGEQGFDDAMVNDVVPTIGPLTRNVSQGPHRLLTDVNVRGGEQLDEWRDSTVLHHCLRLLRIARGNVRESPSRLKLQHVAVCGGVCGVCAW